MKLGTFIIVVILVPELAIAQHMATQGSVPSSMNEQTVAPQSRTDRFIQIAYVAPAERSMIEMKALAARKKFAADPELYSEIKDAHRAEDGIIGEWHERVFKTVGIYGRPRQSDPVNDNRLRSKSELDEQENENRVVARIILKETVRFTQERLPELDMLIKALKLEVSTDMISGENTEAEADAKKTGEAHGARHPLVEDRFFVKTGLRVPVESGKLSLLSETEATYGNLSTFLKVYLDGRYDNTVGLLYVLGRDLRVQVERHVSHATDPVTNDKTNAKSSLNLIQLVCMF